VGFESGNFLFSPLVTLDGLPSQGLFSSLNSSSARVTVLTASNHTPSSTYFLNDSRLNGSSQILSSIIFIQAIQMTLAWMVKFSISGKNLARSPRYRTRPISRRAFSSSFGGPKGRNPCSAKMCQNSYHACFVSPKSPVICRQ